MGSNKSGLTIGIDQLDWNNKIFKRCCHYQCNKGKIKTWHNNIPIKFHKTKRNDIITMKMKFPANNAYGILKFQINDDYEFLVSAEIPRNQIFIVNVFTKWIERCPPVELLLALEFLS